MSGAGVGTGARLARRLTFAAGLLLAGWLLTACHGGPHDFVVNTTADGADANPGDGVCEATVGGGDCTLRAAVTEVNAVVGARTITVPSGTYSLTLVGSENANAAGDLDIEAGSGEVSIQAEAGGAVVDANGADAAIDVRSGTVTLNHLAATGGAGSGVDVRSGATLNVLYGASHDNAGAGVTVEAGASTTALHSTLSSNGAGGAAAGGTLTAVYTTVTANTGGGITGAATPGLFAAVVADQASGADCATPAASSDFNLDSDSTCGLGGTHDLSGVSASLGSLSADLVPSHAPQPGSPAIDGVDPALGDCGSAYSPVDQRDTARPVDGYCDRGAVEAPNWRAPSVWLLEPYDCNALTIPGGAELVVGDISRWQQSGLVTVDSDGSNCSATSRVISVQGGGTIDVTPNDLDSVSRTLPSYGSKIGFTDPCIEGQISPPPAPVPSPYPADNSGSCIDPPGQIQLHAFEPDQINCTDDPAQGNVQACDPDDTAPAPDTGAIQPIPRRRPLRVTRAPIDWRYDCTTGYPAYLGAITVDDCPDAGTETPWVSTLSFWQATSGARTGGQGFTRWNADAGGSCNQPFNTPPSGAGVTVTPGGDANGNHLVELDGNWVVDCDPNGLTVTAGTIAFTGGNVISTDQVAVGNNGIFILNSQATSIDSLTLEPTTPLSSTAPASLAGVSNGSGSNCADDFNNNCWRKAVDTATWYWGDDGSLHVSNGGQVIINKTAVFLDHSVDNLNRFYAQGGITYWTPPEEGPFEALSLWAEVDPSGCCDFGFTGQASTNLAGTFFTPYAYPFKIAGGGSLLPQHAQIVARALTVTGNGFLNLDPTGLDLTAIPPGR